MTALYKLQMLRTYAAFAAFLLGCTADATSEPPPPPHAVCVVERGWPDYRTPFSPGQEFTCGDDVGLSWSATGELGTCSGARDCEPGALCLVRGAEGDAVGHCR